MHKFQSLPIVRSIDLRFIFILTAAFLGDGFTGFLAGLFESAFLLWQQLSANMTLPMIFYNPDNWAPLIFYILFGMTVGYFQNRQRLEIELAERERDFQIEQYQEQHALYLRVLQKKNEYRDNLQNSQNGFGKLYQAFMQLSSVEPEKILAESIPVMEDLLSNHTISIYSIFPSNPDSARLQVASRKILNKTPRSIRLSEHPEVFRNMPKDGSIWFNRKLLKDEPMYIAPIMNGQEMIAFIAIRDAEFSQTSLYYQNMLFVISRMIGSLIITATSYQSEIVNKNYFENTRILKPENLEKRLTLIRNMEEKEITTNRLIAIDTMGESMQEMDERIEPLIRPLDILGQMDAEHILLIAANTDDIGADIIIKRLTKAGLHCALKEVKVYAENVDGTVPVIWSLSVGSGKVVVCNFPDAVKNTRGIFSSAYTLLDSAMVYPVINASTYFLDDFPAPVSRAEGIDEVTGAQTEYQDFLANEWWPDVSALGKKHHIAYTGMTIETYDNTTSGMLKRNQEQTPYNFYGRMLLNDGGEIGIHGYNQPLCGPDYVYQKDQGYLLWSDVQEMRESLKEVTDFTKMLYPGIHIFVYVPPSNILSPEAREMIGKDMPSIFAISSTYTEGPDAYTQEFGVAEDGIIEAPRISSGEVFGDSAYLMAMSELNFHYVVQSTLLN